MLRVEELELSGEFGKQVWQLVAELALQPGVEQVLAERALAELVLLGRH